MDRISGRSLAARLFGASPARTLALLQAAWPLAVGPELARRTEVLGTEGGTLRVRVPDASWRKVLHRIQPQILARLRDLAGDLSPRRMGFVEGGIKMDTPRPPSEAAPRTAGDASRASRPRGGANRPQSTAASRSGGDVRGGFQGGSRVPIEPGASAPPDLIASLAAVIGDPELRAQFAATAARYLARSKGQEDA